MAIEPLGIKMTSQNGVLFEILKDTETNAFSVRLTPSGGQPISLPTTLQDIQKLHRMFGAANIILTTA